VEGIRRHAGRAGSGRCGGGASAPRTVAHRL